MLFGPRLISILESILLEFSLKSITQNVPCFEDENNFWVLIPKCNDKISELCAKILLLY